MSDNIIVELSGDEDKLAERLKAIQNFAMEDLKRTIHIFLKKEVGFDVLLPIINIKKYYSAKPIPASLKLLGESDDAVYLSAGDTRKIALHSQIIIKTAFPEIHPILANTFPKVNGHFIFLDIGASLWPDDKNLFPWIAFAGRSIAELLYKKVKMGLLNIGEEYGKGGEKMEKIRISLLRLFKDEFIGNIEMHNAIKSDINLLVTSGFLGNLTIKTFEGTVRTMKEKTTKGRFKKFTDFSFKALFKFCWNELYWKNYSGAYLLGFKKPILVTHGASDATAFYNALKRACDPATQKIFEKVNNDPLTKKYFEKPADADHIKINLEEKLQSLEEQQKNINREIKSIKKNLEKYIEVNT